MGQAVLAPRAAGPSREGSFRRSAAPERAEPVELVVGSGAWHDRHFASFRAAEVSSFAVRVVAGRAPQRPIPLGVTAAPGQGQGLVAEPARVGSGRVAGLGPVEAVALGADLIDRRPATLRPG